MDSLKDLWRYGVKMPRVIVLPNPVNEGRAETHCTPWRLLICLIVELLFLARCSLTGAFSYISFIAAAIFIDRTWICFLEVLGYSIWKSSYPTNIVVTAQKKWEILAICHASFQLLYLRTTLFRTIFQISRFDRVSKIHFFGSLGFWGFWHLVLTFMSASSDVGRNYT